MKKNASIKDFGRHRKTSKGPIAAETHGKSLGGVKIECGNGTVGTNTMFQASVSKRGVKEAFNPSGPSGS